MLFALRQGTHDVLQYHWHLLQHLVIPIAQHPEAQSLQHLGPPLVIGNVLKMLPSIQLEDQPCIKADKVSDIASQWHLSPEPETSQLTPPQLLP